MRIRNNITQLNASQISDRVGIKAFSSVPDGRGGETVSYANAVEYWAKFMPDSGTRTLQDAGVSFNRSARVYFRWETQIGRNDLITKDGIDYTIHSITNINNADEFIEVICFTDK